MSEWVGRFFLSLSLVVALSLVVKHWLIDPHSVVVLEFQVDFRADPEVDQSKWGRCA